MMMLWDCSDGLVPKRKKNLISYLIPKRNSRREDDDARKNVELKYTGCGAYIPCNIRKWFMHLSLFLFLSNQLPQYHRQPQRLFSTVFIIIFSRTTLSFMAYSCDCLCIWELVHHI